MVGKRIAYNMKNKSVVVFILAVLSLLYCSNVDSAEDTLGLSGKYKGYNVILIILDALRPDHLSCYGYAKQTSPIIDALAKKGVLFKNAFSQASYTLPSATSIFTSVYPYSHRVMDVLKDRVPEGLYTLAQILNIYRYQTVWCGMIGDFHSGSAEGQLKGFNDKYDLPMAEGFEKTEQIKMIFNWLRLHQKEPFFMAIHSYMVHEQFFPFERYENEFLHGIPNEFLDLINSLENRRWLKMQDMLKNEPDIIENLGRDWVKKNNVYLMQPYSQGVFNKLIDLTQTWKQKVIISKIGSDVLYHLLESFNENQLRYFLALLDSAIYKVDEDIIGGLVNQLKDVNLLDKTIIIVTADHGNEYNDHGNFFHCSWLYDEVMRVPLIMYLPGMQKAAAINELAQSIDILPTVLDLLGINIPHQAQGISLAGLMEGRKNALKNDFVYCQGVPLVTIAIRSEDWKLFLKPKDSDNIEGRLFDLKKDPRELRNVYKDNPKIAATLRSSLEAWQKSLVVYQQGQLEFIDGVDGETKHRIKNTGYW